MDNLSNNKDVRRWPKIDRHLQLSEDGEFEVTSAFGGLVFLECFNGGNLSFQISEVIPTPTFTLGQTENDWATQSQHPGLWCHLSGHHISFTIPSKSIRDLSFERLTLALEFWDNIVLSHFELRGEGTNRKEWIVADEQPRLGYMHSGYPIGNHGIVSIDFWL